MGVDGSGWEWIEVAEVGVDGITVQYSLISYDFSMLFLMKGKYETSLLYLLKINWNHSKHGTIIRTGITCKKISV